MNFVTLGEIQTLLANRSRWCVSLFMTTHRAGKESEQDPIRLKNMLRDVEAGLEAKGMRSPEAKALLKPVQQAALDPEFWQHYTDGLAIFVSPEDFKLYHVPLLLDEKAVIGSRFFIRPLLPILTGNGKFFILALSQNQVRLLAGDRHGIEERELTGFAKSLSEFLKYEETDGNRSYRSGTAKSAGPRPSVYHSQSISDEEKDQLTRWFNQINEGLHPMLSGEHSPLILASVDYYGPIYRINNTYAHLMEVGISGSPDEQKAEVLHAQACEILAPYFNQAQDKAISQYAELAVTGKATSDLREAIPAAFQGRVSSLIVPLGIQAWGRFNPATNLVEVHAEPELGDDDLLDLAAIQTILNGGAVYALKPELMPDEAPIAAIFRY